MKNIVLIDPFSGGHHDAYMKIFTHVLIEEGYFVSLIVPNHVELLAILDTQSLDIKSKCAFYKYPTIPKREGNSIFVNVMQCLDKWKKLNRVLCEIDKINKIEHVFFAWFDDYLINKLPSFLLDFYFKFSWSGLYFHPKHMRLDSYAIQSKATWRDIDSVLLSKRCKGIAVHDEGILNSFSKRINNKVVLFPEIADTTPPMNYHPDVDDFKQKANGRKIICTLGTLSPHQGIIELIKLIAKADRQKYFFVLAGPLSIDSFNDDDRKTVLNFIENKPENCWFKFSYIKEGAEFNTFVTNVDILYIVYNNFPSASNRLTKAAYFHKPVISSERFCVGEDVIKYKLGFTVKEGEIETYLEALENCTKYDFDFDKFDFYARLHDRVELREKFKILIG